MAPTQNNRIAMVYCTGGSRAKRREGGDLSYLDCRMAKQAYADGALECAQGCLGVEACRLDAIHIGPHGAAVVDRNACVGCGLCVEACPQNLIRLVDADTVITPRCSNQDAGPVARNACDVSCIACRICEKNCPADAITMENNHAVIHPERCVSCGMCAVKCPRGVIVDANGIFTVCDFE